MEQLNQNLILKELGLENKSLTKDLLLNKLNTFISGDEEFNTVMLCSVLYSSNDIKLKEKASEVIDKILNDRTSYFSLIQDEQYLKNQLNSHYYNNTLLVGWGIMYKQTVVSFVKYPTLTNLLLFVASTISASRNNIPKNDKRRLLIEKMFNFLFNQDTIENLVVEIFKSLPEKPFIGDRCIAYAIRIIINKLVDSKNEQLCIALITFYLYLGKTWITDLFFEVLESRDCDFESLYEEFNKKATWPWYPKYKFDSICESLTINQELEVSTIKFLENADIWYLVPLVLYLHKSEESEKASKILYYIAKKTNFPKINERFQELNGGFDVYLPQSWYDTPVKNKNDWFELRVNQCKEILNIHNKKVFSKRIINRVEEIFSLMPFNETVLTAICRLELLVNVSEFKERLSYGIQKIKSRNLLKSLITEGIYLGNEFIVKKIVFRLNELGYKEELLYGITGVFSMVRNFKKLTNIEKLEFLYSILNSVGENFQNDYRYKYALNRYENLKNKIYKPKTGIWESSSFKLEKNRIAGLLKKRQLTNAKEFIFKNETSIYALESLLKTALEKGRSYEIVEVYSMLAKVNKQIAASHNPEVEFHFCIVNRKLKKSNIFVATSTIWGLPALLENPVNYQTAIVAMK